MLSKLELVNCRGFRRQGSMHGRKAQEVVNVERVLIKATKPGIIVVYINKRRIAPVEFSDRTRPAVELQLGDFAD